jgi:hypothetical protein
MKKIPVVLALLVAASSSLVVARSQADQTQADQTQADKTSGNLGKQKTASQNARERQNAAKTRSQRTASQAPKEAENSFRVMMSALETDDLAAFVAPGETAFAMAFTQPVFAKISAQMAPRLKKGYQAIFLCPMKQRGYDVFLWKLSFKDGGDDLLASLSTKNGKVSGLFLN